MPIGRLLHRFVQKCENHFPDFSIPELLCFPNFSRYFYYVYMCKNTNSNYIRDFVSLNKSLLRNGTAGLTHWYTVRNGSTCLATDKKKFSFALSKWSIQLSRITSNKRFCGLLQVPAATATKYCLSFGNKNRARSQTLVFSSHRWPHISSGNVEQPVTSEKSSCLAGLSLNNQYRLYINRSSSQPEAFAPSLKHP